MRDIYKNQSTYRVAGVLQLLESVDIVRKEVGQQIAEKRRLVYVSQVSRQQHGGGALAGQIGAATGAMGELLDALLEVSRLDTEDIAPQRQALALGPLLESIVAAQRQSAEAKGLRIACVGTQAWTESDPHLLRRLLGNLVANAVRYTHQGGVVVGVRREGAGLRIEVWEHGIGIDAGQLPLVFQEFYQVANRERDAGKGLGLGLAIVERLARMLGHALHAHSRPRRGSVFGVSVPRVAAVAAPLEPETAAATRNRPHPRRRRRGLGTREPGQPDRQLGLSRAARRRRAPFARPYGGDAGFGRLRRKSRRGLAEPSPAGRGRGRKWCWSAIRPTISRRAI